MEECLGFARGVKGEGVETSTSKVCTLRGVTGLGWVRNVPKC